MKKIYNPKFVETLFNKMSSSYSKLNYITSFGFCNIWRKQLIEEVSIEKGKVIIDLMTGMGECWEYILKKSNKNSKLIALDFSTEMINRAKKKKINFKNANIEILKENVFDNSINSEIADVVFSGFGLKTFNNKQLHQLAIEINRILKPNGEFSLIDISVPKNKILSFFYMFYLKKIIPILGKIFCGDSEAYKMLGIYTECFENSRQVEKIFNHNNFKVEYITYFFGCATGIKGKKIN